MSVDGMKMKRDEDNNHNDNGAFDGCCMSVAIDFDWDKRTRAEERSVAFYADILRQSFPPTSNASAIFTSRQKLE